MTAAPRLKTEAITSDCARLGDRTIRVLAAMPCPRCLRARLRASAMRETNGGFAWTCQVCHADIITITAD